MTNLYARLSTRFPQDRDQTFARLADGARVSYADLDDRSARYAGLLRDLGLAPGDRVAVQAEKSIEMLMLYLGALRAGAAFLPLNTAYTAGELDYFIGDAEPALIVCDPKRQAAIRQIARRRGRAKVLTLDAAGEGSIASQARQAAPIEQTLELDDAALAAILYTSGTTGRSKGAMLSHGNLASNAFTLADSWRFTSDDVLLHALPIFHTHGLFVATNVTLAAGASMIFQAGFDPVALRQALPEATVLMGVPTFYIRLLKDAAFTREATAHMRLFISGSAPLSPEIHKAFEQRTGHAILERYGMTETNMNTSNPYDGARRPGTVGRPLPGVDIRIADPETGAEMPIGEVGVIQIRGPNVFQGYWRMPDKTAAEFRDGYFISGDLGFIDAEGYVSIVGRAKDLIISGGYNIYPAEVENALDALPEVRESAVVGAPHPDMGEGVVAVVVPTDPGFIDDQRLRTQLGDQLARFKQPRRFVFVDQLPKNTMGKVQKVLLRDQLADSFQSATN
ncbi:malonyl-CoA synthase [Phenylobacterium sp.]|uniref:malonyl-CoA synthase n=1 Tax=Phenylobacterium sp. TaxID=1871053 RepID=UPI003783E26B